MIVHFPFIMPIGGIPTKEHAATDPERLAKQRSFGFARTVDCYREQHSMNWPWSKIRSQGNELCGCHRLGYPRNQQASPVTIQELASIEAAAGLIGNSLAMAEVKPSSSVTSVTAGIGPHLLNMIARGAHLQR